MSDSDDDAVRWSRLCCGELDHQDFHDVEPGSAAEEDNVGPIKVAGDTFSYACGGDPNKAVQIRQIPKQVRAEWRWSEAGLRPAGAEAPCSRPGLNRNTDMTGCPRRAGPQLPDMAIVANAVRLRLQHGPQVARSLEGALPGSRKSQPL